MDKVPQDQTSAATDAELARRFAAMRASEAESAPPFSRQSQPLARKKVFPTGWFRQPALPRVAAGFVLAASAVVFLSDQPEENPASLYVSIMARQHMQTDSLLQVSEGVLPAMTNLPDIYELEIESDSGAYTN